jgi:hypothetical protein
MSLGSSLGRKVLRDPLSEGEIEELKRRLWHERKGALIFASEINDPWRRQEFENEMNKRYGKPA